MPEYVITAPSGVTNVVLADGRQIPIDQATRTARVLSDGPPAFIFAGGLGAAITVAEPVQDTLLL